MIVVNLFGAPCAGKSIGAAYIFAMLKMYGYNVELIQEFAKDKVYEKSKKVFENQTYIFGKQYFRMTRCADQVDVVIVDSPLLLSCVYDSREDEIGKKFREYVKMVFDSFDNMNFFAERVGEYTEKGRIHNEKESEMVKDKIERMLNDYGVKYERIRGDKDGWDEVVRMVKRRLG